MEAQIENQDCGADFVEAAVRVAQTIDGFEERGEILSSAANIYAESGQSDLALSLVQTIDDSYQRDLALTKIAAVCAAAGDGDQAESLLDMIEDDVAYGMAVEQIAAAYAGSGEIDKAVEIAHRLSDSNSALRSIALACPSEVLLTDCIEIARSINYPELKATTLVELAVRARTPERQSESAELIEEADLAAEAIDFPRRRVDVRVAIAAWYKDNNQSEQAAGVLNKARGDCEEAEGIARDESLEQIATAYAQLREFNSADQLLEEIEDPFQFSDATAEVAFEHYQAGDETASIKLLADGLEVVKNEPVYGQQTLTRREAALDILALTYAAIGRIEDALRVIESLDSQERRDAVLRDIAVSTPAENPNGAFKVIEQIKDDAIRVLCEVDVGRAWTRTGQLALADHLLSNASTEVDKIELPAQRTKCLAELAQAYELREQTSRASESLFAALKTAAMIRESNLQARALLGLAVKHKELTRPAGERERQILEEITDHLD
jgi:tetratricopeptide (TPR) repeat protein